MVSSEDEVIQSSFPIASHKYNTSSQKVSAQNTDLQNVKE